MVATLSWSNSDSSDENFIDGSALNGFLITSPLDAMLLRCEARWGVAQPPGPPGSQQGGHGTLPGMAWGLKLTVLLIHVFQTFQTYHCTTPKS